MDRLSLKFKGKCKSPRIAKTLKKENQAGGFTLPYFKTYHKAAVIKTELSWHTADVTEQNSEPRNKLIFTVH